MHSGLAAHIIPDREEGGEPPVTNGLALCKLHHTAFDAFFLSIRPDYVIEIRRIGLTGSGWRSGIGGIWRRKVWMAAHDSWRKPSAKGIAGIWCNQPDICASDAAPQHL